MKIFRCYDCGSLEDEVRECGADLVECKDCGVYICTDCSVPTSDGKRALCRRCSEKVRSPLNGKT